MTELLPNIFAIEVPEGAKDFQINDGWLEYYNPQKMKFDGWVWVALGDSYEILFTTKDVSKHDAHAILPKIEPKNMPVYYQYHCDEDAIGTTDWEASLQSLLKSKGLTAGNYLIIKKVEG